MSTIGGQGAGARAVSILVVDDDEGHAELARRNLKRSGIDNEVRTLASGDAAVELLLGAGSEAALAGGAGFLVLLDINMPGMDGVEVLRRLKQDRRTRTIPVIMLTTADDPRSVQRCYALGCNVYLTKPIDPAQFVDAIHRLGLLLSIISLPRPEEP